MKQQHKWNLTSYIPCNYRRHTCIYTSTSTYICSYICTHTTLSPEESSHCVKCPQKQNAMMHIICIFNWRGSVWLVISAQFNRQHLYMVWECKCTWHDGYQEDNIFSLISSNNVKPHYACIHTAGLHGPVCLSHYKTSNTTKETNVLARLGTSSHFVCYICMYVCMHNRCMDLKCALPLWNTLK